VICTSYYYKQSANSSENSSRVDTLSRRKKEDKGPELAPKQAPRRRKSEQRIILTINGFDPATNQVIDPINLWSEYYPSKKYSGKVVHHEQKVTLVRRQGDGVLIETLSGDQGWVTYFFIKEY
jgi:hypothetical protein